MDSDRSRFDSAPGEREQMEALAISALAAVQNAAMVDEVNRRLFDLPPEDLLEPLDPANGRSEYRYRPMVELLLQELTAVGADASLNGVERQRRIVWALEMAGF